MQKDDKDRPDLSDIWLELLGKVAGDPKQLDIQQPADEQTIPTLERDPWRALAQLKGIEVIDLQQLRLHMSAQDVEQLLQYMQEQADSEPES